MTQATRSQHNLGQLFDPEHLIDLLDSALPPEWPDRPRDVRIERCWPTRGDGFRFEWSFALGAERRYALFGQSAPEQPQELAISPKLAASCHDPCLISGSLRGVRHHIAESSLLLHSPDCDPDMTQLAGCLEGQSVSAVLEKIRPLSDRNGTPDSPPIDCQLLGYKPGRRAALVYQSASALRSARRILGKTFRDQRGELLGRLHYQLNDAFRKQGGLGVGVSQPLIYVSDLRLMLFEWAPELRPPGADDSPLASVKSAVEVLHALHMVELPDLPLFSALDEYEVVRRWHQALLIADPQAADELVNSLQVLRRASKSMAGEEPCTIHRDFYESQYVNTIGGITLLDLDTLCRGHRCLDVGNFLAHLYLRLLRQGHPPEHFGDLASAMIDKYHESSPAINPEALEFYLASSLFRLGAVHALRTETRPFAKPMWKLMRDRLDAK